MIKKLLGLALGVMLVAVPAFAQAPPTPGPVAVNAGAVRLAIVNTVSSRAALVGNAPSLVSASFYNPGAVDAFCATGDVTVTATTSSPIRVPATGRLDGIYVGADTNVACITASSSTSITVWHANGPIGLGLLGGGGSGGSPTGPAGGDLAGSYPNPNVASYNGGTAFGTAAAANTGTATGNVPTLSATSTLPALSGVNLTALNATNLASGTVPVARLPLATNSTPGASQCDGTTTTCSGGVITAVTSGTGTVTTTGSPASGNLSKFSGATSITNGDLSGDITTSGTLATTLATVNGSPGSVGSSTAIPVITTNGKGLVTAQTTAAVVAPAGTLTGTTLASGVTTAPGVTSVNGNTVPTATDTFTLNAATQTLTNKTVSGASNTISNIATGSLATVQGNGTKVQLSTGTTTTNDCVKYDANGNAVDSGSGCGGGSVSVTAATPNVVVTPSPGTGTFTLGTTIPQRTVTITSDTLSSTDCTKAVQYTNTGGTVAISLPTTATMGTGCAFELVSGPIASASPLTVTPVAGSSVMWQGALVANPSTFTIPANTAAYFSSPNGTNWVAVGGPGIVATSTVQGIASWGTGLSISAGVGSVTNPSPGSSTTNDLLTFSNGTGALQDSGTLLSSLAPKASPTFTGTVTAAALTTTGTNTLSGLAGGGTLCVHANNSGVLSTTSTDCPASASSGGGTLNYSDNGVTVTAGTYFVPPGGGGIPQTTEANVSVKSPAAMTVTNLQVSLSADPGAGQTLAVTLRKGGSDQTLTCTVTGGSGAICQDVAHSVNLALNDVIDWKIVTTGTYVATPTITITAANGTSQVGVTSVSGGTGISVATGSTTPVVSLATIAADSDLSNLTGSTAAPAANAFPNCATAMTYNTTTHARGCNPGPNLYLANNYYPLQGGPTGTSAVGSTTVTRLQPFTINYPMTIGKLCVHEAASGGGHLDIGVYANDSGTNRPTGSALVSTGTMADSANTTICGTASLAFTTPGQYWCAVQVDNINSTFIGANGNGGSAQYLVGVTAAADVSGQATWSYTSTYATMPTITPASVTEGNSASQPYCYVQVSSVP